MLPPHVIIIINIILIITIIIVMGFYLFPTLILDNNQLYEAPFVVKEGGGDLA